MTRIETQIDEEVKPLAKSYLLGKKDGITETLAEVLEKVYYLFGRRIGEQLEAELKEMKNEN